MIMCYVMEGCVCVGVGNWKHSSVSSTFDLVIVAIDLAETFPIEKMDIDYVATESVYSTAQVHSS